MTGHMTCRWFGHILRHAPFMPRSMVFMRKMKSQKKGDEILFATDWLLVGNMGLYSVSRPQFDNLV